MSNLGVSHVQEDFIPALGRFLSNELGVDVAHTTTSCVFCKLAFSTNSRQTSRGKLEFKVLRCLHSACGRCLEECLQSGKDVVCPACDAPSGEQCYNSYLCNFAVHQGIDHTAIAQEQLIPCEECVDACPAELYCEQCVRSLCSECSEHHKRSKATSMHTLVTLSEQKEHGLHRAAYCPKHLDNIVQFFCETCGVMCCQDCILADHESHTYKVPGGSLVAQQRESVKEQIQELRDLATKLQDRHLGLARLIKEFNSDFEEAHNNLSVLKLQVKEAIHERRRMMLQKIDSFGTWHSLAFDKKRSSLTSMMVSTWRAIDFVEKVLARGTNVEVLFLKSYLSAQYPSGDSLMDGEGGPELGSQALDTPVSLIWNGSGNEALEALRVMADVAVRVSSPQHGPSTQHGDHEPAAALLPAADVCSPLAARYKFGYDGGRHAGPSQVSDPPSPAPVPNPDASKLTAVAVPARSGGGGSSSSCASSSRCLLRAKSSMTKARSADWSGAFVGSTGSRQFHGQPRGVCPPSVAAAVAAVAAAAGVASPPPIAAEVGSRAAMSSEGNTQTHATDHSEPPLVTSQAEPTENIAFPATSPGALHHEDCRPISLASSLVVDNLAEPTMAPRSEGAKGAAAKEETSDVSEVKKEKGRPISLHTALMESPADEPWRPSVKPRQAVVARMAKGPPRGQSLPAARHAGFHAISTEDLGRVGFSESTMKVVGAEGDGPGEFRSPCGIYNDACYLYIADTLNRRVQVYKKDTMTLMGQLGLGNLTVGDLQDPSGLCCVGDRHLAIVEYGLDRVLQVTLAEDSLDVVRANVVAKGAGVPGKEQLYGPFGVGSTKERIVLADSCNHRCMVLDLYGKLLFEFGSRGSGPGQFEYPECIAIFQDGHICVSDKDNHRVQIFDESGIFSHIIPSDWQPDNNGQLHGPMGLCCDIQDRLYVCDCGNARVQIFTRSGQWLWSSDSMGLKVNSPTGICIDQHGVMFLASDHCVTVFDMGDCETEPVHEHEQQEEAKREQLEKERELEPDQEADPERPTRW